jgi:hypothetical protein
MAKVSIPKLWASTIASIWTYGRTNSCQGASRYGPRNTCYADKSKIRQIIFPDHFGDLIFVFMESNEYEGDNFVAQYGARMKGCESGKFG